MKIERVEVLLAILICVRGVTSMEGSEWERSWWRTSSSKNFCLRRTKGESVFEW